MRSENNLTPHEEVNNNDKYGYLSSLETSKLQALLQQESFYCSDENFDMGLIQRISAILDEREPIVDAPDTEASLKTFKEEIVPELQKEGGLEVITPTTQIISVRPKRFRRRLVTVLIAAIVSILLGGTLVASAFGYNIWEYVFSWGKDTFQIGTGAEVTAGPLIGPQPTSGGGTVKQQKFKSMDEAVKALGANILVPKWIPESFNLITADIAVDANYKGVTAMYKAENKNIIFSADLYSTKDASHFFEIDQGSVEPLEISGHNCVIMTNINRLGIVWTDENIVYNITGHVSKDDLIKMVKSIYEGEN